MTYTLRHKTLAPRALVIVLLALLWAVSAIAAKNVILMIGDGMGPDVVAAAGAYKYGADFERFGGTKRLAMQTLTNHRYVFTFSAEGKGYDFTWAGGRADYPSNATDSAAAATTMATGVKTYNKAISVDMRRRPLTTILQLAQDAGMKTGVVTTVPFCHATPAAFGAHNANRDDYKGIAHEMITVTQPDVIMGAGNPEADRDPAKAFKYIMPEDWQALRDGKTPYRLITKREEFQALATTPATIKLFGAFPSKESLPYRKADGSGANAAMPTLAEMTAGALATLDNERGFFLMVEGGAIDWAGHANNLNDNVGETLGFDEAVATTLDWIAAHGGWEQNLLIITADHDTGYMRNVKVTETGQLPTVEWGLTGKWGGHTNRLVDLYYQGAGEKGFNSATISAKDYERGDVQVVDDTAIFHVMNAALAVPAVPAK